METQNLQTIPAPPSLIKSLLAGFDAISNHLELIVFAICLDVLLWFGPHLRLMDLIKSLFTQLTDFPELQSGEMDATLEFSQQAWLLFAERFNLISMLRTLPVGIPSLMAVKSPLESPFGNPWLLEASSFSAAGMITVFLIVIGIILGTLYFLAVSQTATIGKLQWNTALNQWPWAILQVFLLSLFFIGLLLAISIPLSCLFSVLFLSGLGLEKMSLILILIFGGLLLWWLLPLVFSPHGIFVNKRTMWISVRDSFRITRQTMPTTGLLILTCFVINEGLNYLWKIPSENSWFTLVGIVGHSFVATSLLAASFNYYRDADSWLRVAQT